MMPYICGIQYKFSKTELVICVLLLMDEEIPHVERWIQKTCIITLNWNAKYGKCSAISLLAHSKNADQNVILLISNIDTAVIF